MLERIDTSAAPAAIGPYSQAVKAGSTLYVSGQIPVDPSTGAFAGDDITSQTRQCFANIKAILAEAGMSLCDVAKMTVLLKNMDDFAAMNAVYVSEFEGMTVLPARVAFEAVRLPKGALVEIDAIAVR